MTQRAIDWGAPRTEWHGPKERVTARVSTVVAAALRTRARREGVSFNTLLQQLLSEAVAPEPDPIVETAWYDEYSPFVKN